MNRLSPQQLDWITVLLLLIILLLAFTLISSLFAAHAPASYTPTPTEQSMRLVCVTVRSAHTRAPAGLLFFPAIFTISPASIAIRGTIDFSSSHSSSAL